MIAIDQLRRKELFKDVPTATLRRLLRGNELKVIRLRRGMHLKLRAGQVEHVYVIVSGYLEVRLDSQLLKKGKSFLIAYRGPEQIVGEMRAIAKEPGEAFISAASPCVLIQIPSDKLTQVAETDWRIYRNIASLLIQKTFQERRRMEVVQMPKGVTKVAQALLNFLNERGAEIAGKEATINGLLRHKDIADYIGCDRTTVVRPLQSLKAKGIIAYPDSGRRRAQQIKIVDIAKLKNVARRAALAPKKKGA